MNELRPNRFAITSAGLVLGIGTGIVVSFLLFPSNIDESSPKTNDPFTVPLDSVLSHNQPRSQVDLASVFKLDAASERRLVVYRLLESQRARQIAELLKNTFKLSNVKHLHSVQNLFFAVLARLDPEPAVELVWETERTNWREYLTSRHF